MSARARSVLAAIFIGAASYGLYRLGGDGLGAPPVSPGSWSGWVAESGPAVAIVACLRVLGLGLGGYLFVATVVWGVCAPSPKARRTASLVVPRFLRGVLGGAAGATVVITGVAAAAGPWGPEAESVGGSSVAADSRAAVASLSERGVAAITDEPRSLMVHLGDAMGAGPESPRPEPAPTSGHARLERFVFEPKPIDLPGVPQPTDVETWTVRCGDHLWAIAEEVLADAGGGAPSTADVERYWRDLVRHNVDRLVDPSNPDLILPGQRFELPPINRPGPERVSGR